MNYLLKNKPKRRQWGKFITVLVIFLVLSFFVFLFPNFIRITLQGIAKPLWAVENVITRPFGSIKEFFSSRGALVSENISLKDQVASLLLKQADYDVLLKENNDLKSQLGRTNSGHTIIARVLSGPPRSPYDTFVLDAGANDGVLLGSRVYISDSVIIGLITNVTPHTSLVELFSTGGQRQEAVDSRTGASFELQGRGGANLSVEVPKDTDILWGDSFLYPGLSSSVIGTVYYLDTNSQSAFKTVYIRIPGNVFSSQSVFIEAM